MYKPNDLARGDGGDRSLVVPAIRAFEVSMGSLQFALDQQGNQDDNAQDTAPDTGSEQTGDASDASSTPEQPAQEPESGAESQTSGEDVDVSDGGKQIPYEAYKSERTKRQTLERELAEARGRISVYEQGHPGAQAQPQPQPEPEIDVSEFLSDPGKYLREFREQAKREAIEAATPQVMSAVELKISDRNARSKYGTEYDQAIDFALSQPEWLQAQLRADPDPGEAVYRFWQQSQQTQNATSVEELREKILAEEKERWELEFRKKHGLEQAAKISGSGSGSRESKTTTPVNYGPGDISKVLGM